MSLASYPVRARHAAERAPASAAAGLGLTAAAVVFAAGTVAFPDQPAGAGSIAGDLAGLAFQLGVGGLLLVMQRTRATGARRAGVALLRIELSVLAVATLWSVLHALLPSPADQAVWLLALEVAWPLSMLGMAVVGVAVAWAARWRGALRWWPLAAGSWLLVAVPAEAMLGRGAVGTVLAVAHLLLGYGTLGVLLATRPDATRSA